MAIVALPPLCLAVRLLKLDQRRLLFGKSGLLYGRLPLRRYHHTPNSSKSLTSPLISKHSTALLHPIAKFLEVAVSPPKLVKSKGKTTA